MAYLDQKVENRSQLIESLLKQWRKNQEEQAGGDYRLGSIWLVRFDPSVGTEIRKIYRSTRR